MIDSFSTMNRRSFIKGSAILGAVHVSGLAFADTGQNLLLENRIFRLCQKLAKTRWRDLFLDITNHQIDLNSSRIIEQLNSPLMNIDRSYPGFEDFSSTGQKGISPGEPDLSLLYHALASPLVTKTRSGQSLQYYPTLAEIELIENYIYARRLLTLEHLKAMATKHDIGIVVYALQYLPAHRSVHGNAAELCFSRTGIGRIGDTEAFYDREARNFTANVNDNPFQFRVLPRRFAAFIAQKLRIEDGNFGPQDRQDGDASRQFWVPLHKLFSGTECIVGLDLTIEYRVGMHNESLSQFHKSLKSSGLQSPYSDRDLKNYPFILKNEDIATLSQQAMYGAAVVKPKAAPMVQPALYKGSQARFFKDPNYTRDLSRIQTGAWKTLPKGPGSDGDYIEGSAQNYDRKIPHFVNVRNRLEKDGSVVSLTQSDNLANDIENGAYDALHYIHRCGDGWIEVNCKQIQKHIKSSSPAYIIIGMPDFYPKLNQRELMLWWQNDVPTEFRTGLFTIPPFALSQTRIAANIDLPIGFSLYDDTMPAIVSQAKVQRPTNSIDHKSFFHDKVGFPDGSPGMFDPGWDTSQRVYYPGNDIPGQKYLSPNGMSSPWTEDAKLCAASGAYWPGVAPDSTRVFQPDKTLSGRNYPWPTIAPMTDEEVGIVPTKSGDYWPWDGVRGPQIVHDGQQRYVVYPDMAHIDYIAMSNSMTTKLTRQIDMKEYTNRILAMAVVYWSLGIRDRDFFNDDKSSAMVKIVAKKSEWNVLSFVKNVSQTIEFKDAIKNKTAQFDPENTYRFHVFKAGEEISKNNVNTAVGLFPFAKLVAIKDEAIAFVERSRIIIKRNNGPWSIDTTVPTF